jgi:hypothetical protein
MGFGTHMLFVCLFLGFARINGIFGCFAVMSGCMIGYGLLGSYINMGSLFAVRHVAFWMGALLRAGHDMGRFSFVFFLLYLFFGLSGLVGRVVAGLSLLE